MIDTNTMTGRVSAAGTGQTATARPANSDLGQDDFLTLMLAQLQSQDPLNPMDNGEFVAQLAQFSTVSGIEKVNSTLGQLGEGMRDFRVATAANLLGHSVLVPGSIARADAQGAIHGVVDLPEAASSVVVSFSDARTGALLRTTPMGAQPAGLMGFDWTGMPPDLVAARTPVQVSVSVTTESGTRQIGPQVYARVLSAQAGGTGADLTLQIEDYGALNALEIEALR
jgi:flagellar basal-body rod modification protein FlgD